MVGSWTSFYPEAAKAIFDLEGIHATSRHIPHTKFTGLIHPGIMGTAPSHEVLKEWNQREVGLINSIQHQHATAVALPPLELNAHSGSATGELAARIATEGARTIPGRPENGGNCDIKNLSRGSSVTSLCMLKEQSFQLGTCTSPKVMVKFLSVVQLKCLVFCPSRLP